MPLSRQFRGSIEQSGSTQAPSGSEFPVRTSSECVDEVGPPSRGELKHSTAAVLCIPHGNGRVDRANLDAVRCQAAVAALPPTGVAPVKSPHPTLPTFTDLASRFRPWTITVDGMKSLQHPQYGDEDREGCTRREQQAGRRHSTDFSNQQVVGACGGSQPSGPPRTPAPRRCSPWCPAQPLLSQPTRPLRSSPSGCCNCSFASGGSQLLVQHWRSSPRSAVTAHEELLSVAETASNRLDQRRCQHGLFGSPERAEEVGPTGSGEGQHRSLAVLGVPHSRC